MPIENIWSEFSSRLEQFIFSKVNDKEVSKDLLQDIFVKIHLNKESLESVTNIKSWLYHITRNTIIDHYRTRKLNTDEFQEDLNHLWEEEETELEMDIQECLLPMISLLPSKYKRALERTTFRNISQKELALEENISYSAAKSRVQRARQMLKEQIVFCCNPKTDVYGNILEKEECKIDC